MQNPLRFFLLAIAICTLYILPAKAQKLTDQEKLYGLSSFWKEASYNFAYFDKIPTLNWESTYQAFVPQVLATKTDLEYYRTLQRFSALLQGGHTSIGLPQHLAQQLGFPAVEIKAIDRRAIVTNVSTTLKDKLPLGSEIIEIEGIPTQEYVTRNVFPYMTSSTDYVRWSKTIQVSLVGAKGTSVQVKIKSPKGQFSLVTLDRPDGKVEWVKSSPKLPPVEFKWLKNDMAHVAINTFGDKIIIDQFRKALPVLHKAKGLIIDLRYNGGGYSSLSQEIVKHLTEAPVIYGSVWKTQEHKASYKAWGVFVEKEDTTQWGKKPVPTCKEPSGM
ncbi:S41 family peptidase [Rufibacter tibetensis]|uniref:S41 family peptidase n=1 Tax=Rufibacter tibetensis TaxID=512763 RepID=UPI0007835989|nr:S41 family peptidase [Rufibacter tibetensis]